MADDRCRFGLGKDSPISARQSAEDAAEGGAKELSDMDVEHDETS
jgi:hypothetical protein